MRQLIGYAMSVIVLAGVGYAFAPRNPSALPATELHVDRVQVNDLIESAQQLVAVGERGTILLSQDQGVSWQAAQVEPQRGISLTGVTALSDQVLLAVGHDSWLLRSTDGGKHWQEVHYDGELGEPLLGIWHGNAEQAVAFGSFGKFMRSNDAGQSWEVVEVNPEGYHLNAMDGNAAGEQMLVGEQGLVMTSVDGGQSWQTLPSFYNGSLFGVVHLEDQRWLVYGMRGHVFMTDDFGQSWKQIELPHANPLYGHVVLDDQSAVVLVGAGSSLVYLDRQGRLQDSTHRFGLGTLTSAVAPNQRILLVGGQRGVYQGENNRLAAGQ